MGSHVTAADTLLVRPRLRGVLHAAGFFLACGIGAVFVAATDGRRLVAAAIFASSAALMLGASALYHRMTWSPRARARMRRVDHAGIYLLIAGTFTAVGLLGLHGTLQRVVLGIAWTGAAASTPWRQRKRMSGASRARSQSTTVATPGRRTLTATTSPVGSVARIR